MKQLLAFCGAGGTGKTTVLNRLSNHLRDAHINHTIFPSIVRSYYAKCGVANQAEFFTLSITERKRFQLGLLDYYYETLIDHMNNHPGLVISDRSPFCHVGYTINGSTDLTLFELSQIQHAAAAFANDYIRDVVFFPYPTPFSQDVDPDAFRFAPPSQNMTIHSLMYTAMHELQTPDSYHILELPKCSSVDERVGAVITCLNI